MTNPLYPESAVARFMANVNTGSPNECWKWKGGLNRGGYGRIWINRKSVLAHRVAWMLANSQVVPDGLLILHRCDNPPCCNPNHLYAGTQTDNMRDASERGRQGHLTKPHTVRRGEQINTSKLTWDQVKTIRSLYKPRGEYGLKRLADMFGVTVSCIHRITSNRTWITGQQQK